MQAQTPNPSVGHELPPAHLFPMAGELFPVYVYTVTVSLWFRQPNLVKYLRATAYLPPPVDNQLSNVFAFSYGQSTCKCM